MGSSTCPVDSSPITTAEIIAMYRPKRKEGPSSKFLVYTLAILVVLSALLLVAASIVMHLRIPEVELRSAKLMHISYSTSPSPSFNASMIVHLTIKNLNFGRFVYEENSVSVVYRGTRVGVSKMGSGRIMAGESRDIKLALNVGSNKLLVPVILNADLHSGILKLRIYAKLNGTVYLLRIAKKRKTLLMACTIYLNLTSRSLHHFRC